MINLTRRDVLKESLNLLVFPMLIQSAFSKRLIANHLESSIAAWVKRLDQIAADLKLRKLSVAHWRKEIDRGYAKGEFSSIGLQENNVHWFTAKSDVSYLLDIGVRNLENRPTPGPIRELIDLRPSARSDGIIEAPLIDRATALRLFG